MPYDPYEGVYQYIDQETGFPHQTTGHRAKQPLPRRDVLAAARQRNQHRNTQLPQDALPKGRQTQTARRDDEAEEEFEDEYPPRLPTSTRRYDVGLDGLPTQRRTRVEEHYHDEPLVTERQPIQRRRHAAPGHTRRIHVHWLVYVGLGLLLMLAGYIALNVLGTWWQVHQDDSTYGNPRTFQNDAVVGHFDSASNPTHFIAINLKGQVIVIELPGGDTSKARSYNITTIPDNSSNPPVRLAFQDLVHHGKLDMVVEIGDPGNAVTIFFYNNGVQFVPKL